MHCGVSLAGLHIIRITKFIFLTNYELRITNYELHLSKMTAIFKNARHFRKIRTHVIFGLHFVHLSKMAAILKNARRFRTIDEP